ncbi:MAG TPA: hypothetical protein VJJ80_01720 [Patescibacteria group bacterium]|nr:hypothetical protein [Patescibacteria group bacterium]
MSENNQARKTLGDLVDDLHKIEASGCCYIDMWTRRMPEEDYQRARLQILCPETITGFMKGIENVISYHLGVSNEVMSCLIREKHLELLQAVIVKSADYGIAILLDANHPLTILDEAVVAGIVEINDQDLVVLTDKGKALAQEVQDQIEDLWRR